MRSVRRGPWPTKDSGRQISFSDYKRAKLPLVERIGEYCSYCERKGDLEVEHVVPKSIVPALESEWSNFLLGCRNCNSIKLNKNQSRLGYLWPDRNKTFCAFVYCVGGRICVSDSLGSEEHEKASALFDLVGLGRNITDTDRRRHKSHEAWNLAVKVREIISDDASQTIAIELAKATGFFSVWMAVFSDDDSMRQKLIKAFPGTHL